MTKRRIDPAAKHRAQQEILDIAQRHGLSPTTFARFRGHQTGEYLIGVYKIERGRTITITVPVEEER